MKRQLLELWEEKWKHGTYTKSLVSNSISSQKEEKRGEKKRVNMIKDNQIFSDPGTFV